MQILEIEEKIKRKFFVFQITVFELGVAMSRNVQEDTWHWQAVCQQTHQRFQLTLGETFSKSTSLRILKKDERSALMEIIQVFGPLSHVDFQSVF